MFKVSIVTISYNQSKFLEQAIRSVIEQDYADLEYIVVDPGSTDGSRAIIDRHHQRIQKIIYEPDHGPADGLNKGFAHASGDIFAFLNSDDVLYPHAVSTATRYLERHSDVEVVSANSNILDADGTVIRRAYSDRFSLRRYAYGASVLLQQSTFFRRSAFVAAGGFNPANRFNWDGELWADMALNGARFALCDGIWSGFRLHEGSVTTCHKADVLRQHSLAFNKIMGRNATALDSALQQCCRMWRHMLNPRDTYERILHGRISGRRLAPAKQS